MKDVDLDKLRVDHDAGPAPRARRFGLRWWQVALVLALAAGAVYVIHPPALVVDTTQVVATYPSQQFVALNATGYVVARRKAAVASKGTGRVEWLGVTEGSLVKEGELIARLENRDVVATLDNAVANTAVAVAARASAATEIADAQRNLERMRSLQAKNFASQTQLDDALSRVARARDAADSAAASVTAARANESFARNAVDYTNIRAPFDGVVLSKAANIGDIVTPMSSAADAKGAVVVMADMSTLEVDAEVSESALAKIKVDQPCQIILDAFPTRRFRGLVSTIVPTVNRASATVTTKVRILDPDSSILPDMSAKVGFLTRAVDIADEQPVNAVNPDAIVSRDGQTLVYRVAPTGTATAVPVAAGALLGDVRAVTGAVAPGDLLILKPAAKVRDGTRIKLAETD